MVDTVKTKSGTTTDAMSDSLIVYQEGAGMTQATTSVHAGEVVERAAGELQANFNLNGAEIGLLLVGEGARRLVATQGEARARQTLINLLAA